MYAKDSQTVLKGGTIWYEGREALGPGKDAEESDERARKEASIYEILGRHERILEFHGLETGILGESVPKAWAVRLERAPHGSLRDHIVSRSPADADPQTRLQLAVQLAEGVACDFADSDLEPAYPRNWYGCEARCCPPGFRRPRFHTVGTWKREIREICEIVE